MFTNLYKVHIEAKGYQLIPPLILIRKYVTLNFETNNPTCIGFWNFTFSYVEALL
jgi:hypothetical protein